MLHGLRGMTVAWHSERHKGSWATMGPTHLNKKLILSYNDVVL